MPTGLPMEADDMPPTDANGSAATGRNFRDDAARALRAVFSSDDTGQISARPNAVQPGEHPCLSL